MRRTPGRGHGWWPLIVLASAHLMVILDTTVIFVALPSVQRALGLSVPARQWVVTSYTLAFAALLLLGGRLVDRLGARRTLMIGVTGFACASTVGGASAGAAMLIAARAVQGAFGAVLVSSTKSLLITVYPKTRERALAMGTFSATLTAGAAAGLFLGGVITSGLGWRWCLYVNVPLSLAAVAGAARVLPPVPGRPGLRLDVISALLASAGMTTLVYGLGEAASAGWSSARVTGSLAASAALLVTFVIRQAKRPGPLLPLRIPGDRNRGGALIALVVNSLSTFGMMLVLTYQLQSVMRFSPLHAGLALIPFAAAAAIGAALIAPRLLVRVPPRWLITAGIVLSAAGLLPLTRLAPASHYLPLILAATIVEGLGTGLGGPPALNTALRAVRPADAGAASALSSAASQLGSSVGAALLNTIAATAAAAYLAAHATATAAHTSAAGAAGTVHGYAVAAGWGAAVLLVAAIPIGILVNAPAPAATAETPRPGAFRRWSKRAPGSPEPRSGVRQP